MSPKRRLGVDLHGGEVCIETTFGQMPELEVDGQTIAQSDAIARYLAKEFGLAGKTAIEEAHVNAVADAFGDLLSVLLKVHFPESDDDKKENQAKIPAQLACLESYLVKQNGGDGYFVGDSLTWADLKAFHLLSNIRDLHSEVLTACPKLAALCDRVGALPNIKAWVDKRPVTQT